MVDTTIVNDMLIYPFIKTMATKEVTFSIQDNVEVAICSSSLDIRNFHETPQHDSVSDNDELKGFSLRVSTLLASGNTLRASEFIRRSNSISRKFSKSTGMRSIPTQHSPPPSPSISLNVPKFTDFKSNDETSTPGSFGSIANLETPDNGLSPSVATIPTISPAAPIKIDFESLLAYVDNLTPAISSLPSLITDSNPSSTAANYISQKTAKPGSKANLSQLFTSMEKGLDEEILGLETNLPQDLPVDFGTKLTMREEMDNLKDAIKNAKDSNYQLENELDNLVLTDVSLLE
jgi:hypothetical protein